MIAILVAVFVIMLHLCKQEKVAFHFHFHMKFSFDKFWYLGNISLKLNNLGLIKSPSKMTGKRKGVFESSEHLLHKQIKLVAEVVIVYHRFLRTESIT